MRPELGQQTRRKKKTMTRRLVRTPPLPGATPTECQAAFCLPAHVGKWMWETTDGEFFGFCPYGRVGDQLWVKEPYYQFGYWQTLAPEEGARPKQRFVASSSEIRYSDNPPPQVAHGRSETAGWYKRLARFMPYSASRTLLEITAVRVELLQQLSEADALAEGVAVPVGEGAVQAFSRLWETIHGAGTWATPVYVWAITFQLLD